MRHHICADRQPRLRQILGATFAVHLLASLLTVTAAAQVQIVPTIVTAAGTGTAGFGGDSGQASAAKLSSPTEVVFDNAGNLYVSDTANQRVRKITPAGVISTVAGTGTAGFNGDGLATLKQLNGPQGLAVDVAGDLYIADSLNQRVRELVVSTGNLITVAGNGTAGFSGDGLAATQAELNLPVSLAVDSAGDIYISDSSNNRVRIVTAGVISTFAGSGPAGPGTGSFSGDGDVATNATFANPGAILIDQHYNLLIWDAGNYRLRAVTIVGGDNFANFVSEVSGTGIAVASGDGGPYSQAGFVNVTGIASNASTLYLVDSGANEVRAVDYDSGFINTVAGKLIPGSTGDGGLAPNALLFSPNGVALGGNGNVYVTDSGNNRIRVIGSLASFGLPSTAIGNTSAPTTLYLSTVTSETITSFAVPPSLSGIQEFSVGTVTGCVVDGKTINVVGTICQVPVTFKPGYPGLRDLPLAVVTGNGQTNVGLSGTGVGPLAALTPGGVTTLQGLGTLLDNGAGPGCAVMDSAGNLYICDTQHSYIDKVDAITGVDTTIAGDGYPDQSYDGGPALGNPIGLPVSVAIDSAQNLYICDELDTIYRVDQATGLIHYVVGLYPVTTDANLGDGEPARYANVSNPQQIAVSLSGNLYIADTDHALVRMVDASTGIISTVAGVNPGAAVPGNSQSGLATSTPIGLITGVAVDAMDNLYIGDTTSNVIRKVDAATGLISTIAGTGTAGFSGDGGPATAAEFSAPKQLALDAAGNLYVNDAGNLRIRRIDAASGNISTVMGSGVPFPYGPTTTNYPTYLTPGSATSIGLSGPTGVSISSAGNLLVADNGGDIFLSDVAAAVLNYPTIQLPGAYDTADNPQSFSVANIGNATLTLSAPSSGKNPSFPSGAALDASSTCPQLTVSSASFNLAPGTNCGKYGVDLTEGAVGTNSSIATLQDNSLNASATQTVTLVGTAASAGATITTLSSITWVANGIDDPTYSFDVTDGKYDILNLDYGSIVTFTASVTHQAAGATQPITGTMAFYVNGTLLSGGGNIPVQNGVATFTTTNLPVGNDAFTATFTPGPGLTGSTTAQGPTYYVLNATPAINYTPVEASYDGKPHAANFTVKRSNLQYTLLYVSQLKNLVTINPPTEADTYTLELTFTTPNYAVDEVLPNAVTIDRALGAVALSNLSAMYDGNPHAVTVTTTPANQQTYVTYNGSTTAPSAAGSYQVTAAILGNYSNYTGRATGTLVITSGINSVWVTNDDSTVSHLSTAGAILSTVGTPTGTSTLGSIAVDSIGDAWSVANSVDALTEVSPSGTLVGTYNGAGLTAPTSLAVDGLGQIWVTDTNNAISAFTNSGTAISPATGYQASTLNAPSAIAIDQSGSVWIANQGSSTVTRLIGAAAPVVTSTVSGVTQSTPGSRP